MPSSSSAAAAKKKDFFPSPETDNKKSTGDAQRNPITARSKTVKNRFSTPTKQQQQKATPTTSRSSSVNDHENTTKSRRRSPSPGSHHHRAHSSMFGTSPRFANITKDGFTIIESPRASPAVQQVRRTASASASDADKSKLINTKEFTNTKGGVIGRADRWRVAETIDGKLGKDPKSDLVFRRSVSKDRSPCPASRSHSESHQQQQQSSSSGLGASKTTPHKISIRTPDHSAPLNNAKQRKLHIQQLVDVYRPGSNNNKDPLSVQSTSNISSPHIDTARAPFQPATQQNSPRLPNQQQQQQSYYDETQDWNKNANHKNAPMLPNFIESVAPNDEKQQQKKMVRSNSTGGLMMTPRGKNNNNNNNNNTPSSPFFVARSPSVGVAPTNSVRSNRSASLRQQRSASAGIGGGDLSANRRQKQDSVFNRNPVFEKNFETNHHIDPRLSSPMYRKERSSSCFNNNNNNRSNSSASQQQQPHQQYHRSPSAAVYYAGGNHQEQNGNESGAPLHHQPPTAIMGRTKRFSVAKDFDYQNLDAFFSSWLKNAKQTGLYQSPSSASQQQHVRH